MKKIITMFLLVILIFMLTSCSSKDYGSNSVNENSNKDIYNFFEELDKLPKKYNLELAQKNGDVVSVHGKGYNIDKLEGFIEKFKNKKLEESDKVRITTYTVEGDAIIHELIFSDKDMKLIVDNTRDEFAGSDNRKKKQYKVLDISKYNKNEGIFYTAKTDKDGEIHLIYITK